MPRRSCFLAFLAQFSESRAAWGPKKRITGASREYSGGGKKEIVMAEINIRETKKNVWQGDHAAGDAALSRLRTGMVSS